MPQLHFFCTKVKNNFAVQLKTKDFSFLLKYSKYAT